jgi:hypothetical protein
MLKNVGKNIRSLPRQRARENKEINLREVLKEPPGGFLLIRENCHGFNDELPGYDFEKPSGTILFAFNEISG